MIFKQQGQDESFMEERKANLITALSSGTPLSVNIEPTTVCDLKCNFCFAHSKNYENKIKPKFMNLDFYCHTIIDQIKDMNWDLRCLWYLGYGEPLLHRDLCKMIKYAKSKNIAKSIELATNGTNLTDEMLDTLIDSGINKLHLSLDAVDRETYKKMKGKDCFDLVISNVQNAIKKAERLKKFDFIIKVFDEINDPKVSKNYDINKVLFYFKSSALNSEYVHVKLMPLINPPSVNQFSDETCEYVFYYLFFLANGTILPCCSDIQERLSYGNLNKSTLRDIFYSENLKQFRRAHLNKNLGKYPLCQRCDARTCVSFDSETIREMKSILNEE